MLSVCVLEKQRLASHLNVCGFITEGERENKTERKEEETKDNRVIKREERAAQSQRDGGELQITHLAAQASPFITDLLARS